MCRVRILKSIHPVDCVKHRYGWGIDVYTAFQTLRQGFATVVDDRTVIYHPKAVHEIDEEAAYQQSKQICLSPEYQSFCERIWRAQLLTEQLNSQNLDTSAQLSDPLDRHIEESGSTGSSLIVHSGFMQWLKAFWPSRAAMNSHSAEPIEHHHDAAEGGA